MNRYLKIILLFIFFYAFVKILKSFSEPENFYITEVRKSYSGIIVAKYSVQSSRLKTRTQKGIVEMYEVADSLWKVVNVGDSMVKIPNRNLVILYQKNLPSKYYIYMWIPQAVLDGKNWYAEYNLK